MILKFYLKKCISLGRLGTIFQLFIVIGILYSYTSGAFMNYVPFCIACGFWVILHFFGVLAIPESPYHLMNINDPNGAAVSLQILRDSSDTTEELASIKVSLTCIILCKIIL